MYRQNRGQCFELKASQTRLSKFHSAVPSVAQETAFFMNSPACTVMLELSERHEDNLFFFSLLFS